MSAFGYVQSAKSTATGTLAYPSNVTAGNILFAFLTVFGGYIPSSITDTQGNTWVLLWALEAQGSTGGNNVGLFAAIAKATGANSVTVSLSPDPGWVISEYSISTSNYAIALITPTIVTTAAPSGSGITLASTGTAIPSGPECFAITFAYDQHSGHAWTNSTSTIRQQFIVSAGGGESVVAGDQDLGSGGITLAAPYATTYSGAASTVNSQVGGGILLIALSSGGGTLALASLQVSNGVIGVAYSDTVSAFGGTSPYTYAVTSGALPAGLALNTSTGVISGTPTTAGTSPFTITATDAASVTVSRAFSSIITGAGGGGSYAFVV